MEKQAQVNFTQNMFYQILVTFEISNLAISI